MITNATNVGLGVGWSVGRLEATPRYEVMPRINDKSIANRPNELSVVSPDFYSGIFEINFDEQQYLLLA